MNLRELLAFSLHTELTWCEAHRAPAYDSGWRRDPFLVVILSLDEEYRLDLAADGGDGRRLIIAHPGDMLLVAPGTRHSLTAPECTIRGLNVKYSLFGGLDLLSFFDLPPLLHGATADHCRQLIDELLQVSGRRSSIYPVPASEQHTAPDLAAIVTERRLLLQLLEHILCHATMRSHTHARLSGLEKIKPALDHIHGAPERSLEVRELAGLCGFSERHFRMVFKQAVGQSPLKYRNSKRIEKSMEMLAASDAAVADIARELNFFDQPHFTRAFKQQCGLSPQFYQKDIQRKLSGEALRAD